MQASYGRVFLKLRLPWSMQEASPTSWSNTQQSACAEEEEERQKQQVQTVQKETVSV